MPDVLNIHARTSRNMYNRYLRIREGGAVLSPPFAQKKPLELALLYAGPALRLDTCWLTTAVPCRQRAAESRLWSHLSYAYPMAEPPLVLFGANALLVSSLLYAWPITRPYVLWLATAVPRRQRATHPPLWSNNGGATAATVGSGRSRRSRISYAYQMVEPPSQLPVSPLQCAWRITRLYARRLATDVPRRQRSAQSPLRSNNGAATAGGPPPCLVLRPVAET